MPSRSSWPRPRHLVSRKGLCEGKQAAVTSSYGLLQLPPNGAQDPCTPSIHSHKEPFAMDPKGSLGWQQI